MIKKPRSLREQYIKGLEVLGYFPDPKRQSSIYLIYRKQAGEMRFLVGSGGALRMTSTTIERSRPAGAETKNHVITAPERRLAVFMACRALETFESWPDAEAMAKELQERDAGMATLPFKSLLAHVKAWKAHEDAKAHNQPTGADISTDRGGAAPQLPQGSPGSSPGSDVV